MITPELDDYIKKNTQIKEPVYFRKLRALSQVAEIGGNFATSPVNQDENVVFILIVDIIISYRGTAGAPLADFRELTYAENANIMFRLFSPAAPTTIYLNNIYHLVRSENFTCNFTELNSTFSIGYIKISQKT